MGAIQCHLGDLAAECRHARQLVLQPQARGHQDLVIAAATGMDLATGVAQALGQARFDGRMAILEALVQHEAAIAEIGCQQFKFALQSSQLIGGKNADVLQALCMGPACGDVVQEELAIQDHVIAGQEGLDARIPRYPGLLPDVYKRQTKRSTVSASSPIGP